MPCRLACTVTRRRWLVGACALALLPRPALSTVADGVWVLAQGGHQLLHLDTQGRTTEEHTLPTPWRALWRMGPAALGWRADGHLQRSGGPVAPAPWPTHLATSADGQWLLTVEGAHLQLRDATLRPLRHWPLPGPVAWLLAAPRRQAFLVDIAQPPQLWQLSTDPHAEDFYDGLVHDWRFGEGVPKRAFLQPRRMPLPAPLAAATLSADEAELAGTGWVFNLDARRRSRVQPLLAPPGPGCGAVLQQQGQALLLLPVAGQPRLDLYRSADWERVASITLPQPAVLVRADLAGTQAVAQAPGQLWALDLARLHATPLHHEPALGPPRWLADGSGLWALGPQALLLLRPGEPVHTLRWLEQPVAMA